MLELQYPGCLSQALLNTPLNGIRNHNGNRRADPTISASNKKTA